MPFLNICVDGPTAIDFFQINNKQFRILRPNICLNLQKFLFLPKRLSVSQFYIHEFYVSCTFNDKMDDI